MRVFKFLIPGFVFIFGLALFTPGTYGKPEDAKKTGEKCVTCHPPGKMKELTEAGKYYKEKKTLDGYKKK
ncbi:MAG TPA: hypothetical protein VFQ79_19840 [Bryobacteraceae bacterium]|nr:hypothetical protein [Bryobacteraceae bacterium]